MKHNEVGIESIGVVCDHTIYSKALEIQQKYQEKFKFVAFIAKKFCDAGPTDVVAGLTDVTDESGVISVGSVGRVLDGKAYKRAMIP